MPYLPSQFQYHSKVVYDAADLVCIDNLAKHFLNIGLSISDAKTLLSEIILKNLWNDETI